MSIPKKRIIIACTLTVIIFGGGAAGAYIFSKNNRAAPHKNTVIKSNHHRITLRNLREGSTIKNNAEIAGTFAAQPDQALLYSLTGDKDVLLAAGTISSDDKGNFSRNVALSEIPKHKSTIKLTIYAQNKKGETTDSLSLPLTFDQ